MPSSSVSKRSAYRSCTQGNAAIAAVSLPSRDATVMIDCSATSGTAPTKCTPSFRMMPPSASMCAASSWLPAIITAFAPSLMISPSVS